MTVIYGIKNCDTIKKACLQVSPTTRSTASIATGWRNGHWLIELDAKIGRPIESFGDHGMISIGAGALVQTAPVPKIASHRSRKKSHCEFEPWHGRSRHDRVRRALAIINYL
jgi:hypothetical protein